MLSLVDYLYRRLARLLVLSGVAALVYGAFELYGAAGRLVTDVRAEARVESILPRCVATVAVMGAGIEKIGTCAELKGLGNGLVQVSEPVPVTIAHAVLVVGGRRYAKDFRLDPEEVEAVTRSRRIAVAYDPADPAAFREPLGLAGFARHGRGLGTGLALLGLAFAAHRLSRLRAEAAEAARDALWGIEDREAAERGDARAPAGFGRRRA